MKTMIKIMAFVAILGIAACASNGTYEEAFGPFGTGQVDN